MSTIISKIIFIILIMMPLIQCGTNFHFLRLTDCITPTNQSLKGPCMHWNQTTTLYRYSDTFYYCFPGDLYVLTRDGPIQMKYLTLQHQIWSFDIQTQKNNFVSIISWLHHDPSSIIQYKKIQVTNKQNNNKQTNHQQNNFKFLSSDYHNIAFINNSKIDFKFLNQLKSGDQLISLGYNQNQHKLIVDNIDQTIQKQGLYSPFTDSGSFYIFPESFNLQKYYQNDELYPMILVHSLSQMRHPAKNFNRAKLFLKTTGFLFRHQQPRSDQEYVNPLIESFKGLFGSDWVDVEGRLIAHRYSSAGHQRVSSSRSTYQNQQKQQRKRKTIAVLGLGTMMKDVLI